MDAPLSLLHHLPNDRTVIVLRHLFEQQLLEGTAPLVDLGGLATGTRPGTAVVLSHTVQDRVGTCSSAYGSDSWSRFWLHSFPTTSSREL